MTDENLMRAINALKDLIDIAGLPKNESFFWDEARRKLAELKALRDQRSKHK